MGCEVFVVGVRWRTGRGENETMKKIHENGDCSIQVCVVTKSKRILNGSYLKSMGSRLLKGNLTRFDNILGSSSDAGLGLKGAILIIHVCTAGSFFGAF